MKRKRNKPAPSRTIQTGIHIGAEAKAIEAARAAIFRILDCKRSDECITEALRTFGHICHVSHVTLTNCTVKG